MTKPTERAPRLRAALSHGATKPVFLGQKASAVLRWLRGHVPFTWAERLSKMMRAEASHRVTLGAR